MTFEVYRSKTNPLIGGHIALEQLEQNLLTVGEMISADGDIVIYPELTEGNPLGKTCVRWLLSTPGFSGKDRSDTWGKDDLLFAYSSYYGRKFELDGLLTAYDWGFDVWKDMGLDRDGVCYAVRKGYRKEKNQHPVTARPLDGYKSQEEVKYYFNLCERFISYDDQTMLSVQAALCGCESIVVPNPDLTASEWRDAFPYFRYGIAYGFSTEERLYARETLGFVKKNLMELSDISLQQTKEFAQICKEML